MSSKMFLGIVAVVIVGVVGYSLWHGTTPKAAGVQYDRQDQVGDFTQGQTQGISMTNGTLRIGTTGTYLDYFGNGTCNASTAGLPLAASSSISMTCAATGVSVGDSVAVNLPAQPTAYGSFAVGNARVSATDTITFDILNFVGAATSSFRLATTSVMWSAWH